MKWLWIISVGTIIVLLLVLVTFRPNGLLVHVTPGKPHSPKDCFTDKINSNGKIVVTLGDSLTYGTMSYNYVEILQQQLGNEGFQFVNAGRNSDLAYNVKTRLDEVIACDPDYVTILVGANDVFASFSEESAHSYRKQGKLPKQQQPSREWYKDNLTAIVQRLQEETDAQIVLLTLSLFGEDLKSAANRDMTIYSQTVIEVAEETGVSYLPLHETFREHIKAKSNNPRPQCAKNDFQEYQKAIKSSIVQHSVLFKSWDNISKDRGFYIVLDCVHLNRTGASMIADLIRDWLQKVD